MKRLTALMLALLLCGCGDDNTGWYEPEDGGDPEDAGGDASTDTDSESESEDGGDPEDAGGDASTDTDSESESETESESESDSETESTTEDTDTGDGGIDTETEDTDTGDTETTAYCPEGSGNIDEATGLCWQVSYLAGVDKAGADSYCAALVLDGFDGWRLPSRDDYINILEDCSESVLTGGNGYCDSCADSPTCHELLGAYDAIGCFWASTYVAPGTAWGVCMPNGWVASGPDDNTAGYVRCVRGG